MTIFLSFIHYLIRLGFLNGFRQSCFIYIYIYIYIYIHIYIHIYTHIHVCVICPIQATCPSTSISPKHFVIIINYADPDYVRTFLCIPVSFFPIGPNTNTCLHFVLSPIVCSSTLLLYTASFKISDDT